MTFPRLYPIADEGLLRLRGITVGHFAEELQAAGVGLMQYRNKVGGPQAILRDAALIWEVFDGSGCRLILNDRADLVVLAGFDGVHVGQGDLSPEDAKRVFGGMAHLTSHPSQMREGWGTRTLDAGIVGVSTHNDEQVRAADASCADYVAVGPVFATGTKLDAEPVIGLEGVRRARALTMKPLVAIGGITRENARNAIDSGADSVAVISAFFVEGETVKKVAEDFLRNLR